MEKILMSFIPCGVHFYLLVRCVCLGCIIFRVATHLENLENLEKSGNLRVVTETSGKKRKSQGECSCVWSITASIDLDA